MYTGKSITPRKVDVTFVVTDTRPWLEDAGLEACLRKILKTAHDS